MPAMLLGTIAPIRTVLLATDLSLTSDEATQRAIELSVALSARLLIVNVIDPHGSSRNGPPGRIDQTRAAREAALVALVRDARARGARAEFLVWTGDPAASIAAAVEAEHADMLVVGTRGLGRAGRLLLGSVSDDLVRQASCPVLVVRRTARSTDRASEEAADR